MRAGFALLAFFAVACTGEIDGERGGGGDGNPSLSDGGGGAGGDAAPSGLSPDELALLAAMNDVRQNMSLPLLEPLDHLMCAARRHADDVGPKNLCSHTGSDGSDPGDRAAACGGGWSGEIIACGQATAADAVQAWLGSPGHRAVLTDPNNRHVGVAMNNHYWVGIFSP